MTNVAIVTRSVGDARLEQIAQLAREGFSRSQVCSKLGLSRRLLQAICKNVPGIEFSSRGGRGTTYRLGPHRGDLRAISQHSMVPYKTVLNRMSAGWSLNAACMTPRNQKPVVLKPKRPPQSFLKLAEETPWEDLREALNAYLTRYQTYL